jgi:hypothetical protein
MSAARPARLVRAAPCLPVSDVAAFRVGHGPGFGEASA